MLLARIQYRILFIALFAIIFAACAGPGVGSETEQPGIDQPDTGQSDTGQSDTDRADTLQVVSTVSPVTNIVYNIGGDRLTLTGIVPEGVNSHTFEPAPSDARALAEADVIFLNGLNLEEPTLRLAEANVGEDAEIVLLGDLTVSADDYVYDFSFPEAAGSPNPHLWPNPIHALRYAEIVRDTLSERDPDNAEFYASNYAAFETRINELDTAIAATIESIPAENRKLLTYHDSWAYFSPRYGTTVIGAIQPADFSEPSAREVADLITQLREAQTPAIFGSEVFPSPILDQIAKEAGVAYVDTLRDDDLPGAPGDANHSYIGMMVENVRIMAEVLGGDPALIADFDTSNIPGDDSVIDQAKD